MMNNLYNNLTNRRWLEIWEEKKRS